MAKNKINRPENVNPTVIEALADRDYWTEWGKPLGLDLRGFNGRRSASFYDRATGILIDTQGQFAFLERLRKESIEHGGKRVG